MIDAKLEEKLETSTKRVETVEKNMATKTDMHDIAEDEAGFFHKTWEKMDETNERVTIIEDQVDIPHQKELVRFLPSYGVRFFSAPHVQSHLPSTLFPETFSASVPSFPQVLLQNPKPEQG